MLFHSTNKKSKGYRFSDALRHGLAPDKGLFMPDRWPRLPKEFFKHLAQTEFKEIAFTVAKKLMVEVPQRDLKKIIRSSFHFPVPLKPLGDNLFVLELFHGPTMAFKDFGARFLSRSLRYFLRFSREPLNIIVATSGDTGSAVASGFFGIPSIKVFILYPSGKVSPLQEKQLTTYGGNVTAIEVKGTFDDCQKLVKTVLADTNLNRVMKFSSANSINFGRLLPQSFYYFSAVAQLKKRGIQTPPVIVVPSGNLGNLFAGLMAQRMGLPVSRFVAATNANDVVPRYLKSGRFQARMSRRTISNAMDVGNPSNFARVLEFFGGSRRRMAAAIAGISVSDAETRQTVKKIFRETGYVLDPHTAVGVTAALRFRTSGTTAPIVVLATAHPAKFLEVVEPLIGKKIPLPRQLQAAMRKRKRSVLMQNDYQSLKNFLLGILSE